MTNGSAETEEDELELSANAVLVEGVPAGFAAAIVMGIIMSVTDPGIIRDAIAALYGFEGNLIAGWIAHIAHGIVFGVLFAAVLREPGLSKFTANFQRAVSAGVIFGLVLAVIATGMIMPMWLTAVGFPQPPSIPNITAVSLLWHIVYGAVLGGIYTVFRRERYVDGRRETVR